MEVQELSRMPLFAGLKDSELEELLSAPHRRRVYPAGKTIMSAGDAVQSLMVLAAGRVETRMGGDEREVVMNRLAAPCLLAPAFLFASVGTLPVDVMAIEECTVWTLNREGFVRFMAAHPDVMRRFLRMISDRSRFLSEKVRTFAIKGLRNRVLDYLHTHGPITQVAATAERLGVTRPSLSRVLSEMVSEGIIETTPAGYKRIV